MSRFLFPSRFYYNIILISANNVDSCVINGYFVKISNLNVPYIT